MSSSFIKVKLGPLTTNCPPVKHVRLGRRRTPNALECGGTFTQQIAATENNRWLSLFHLFLIALCGVDEMREDCSCVSEQSQLVESDTILPHYSWFTSVYLPTATYSKTVLLKLKSLPAHITICACLLVHVFTIFHTF